MHFAVGMKRCAASVSFGLMVWLASAGGCAAARAATQTAEPGAALATPVASLPDAKALSLEEFSKELQRLENLIGGGKSPDHFAALQRQLPADWQVQAQGRTYSIAAAPLVLLLRKDSSDDAEAWLHNLRAQVDSAEADSEERRDDANRDAPAVLKNILADSRFGKVAPPGWLEVQRQKIYRPARRTSRQDLWRNGSASAWDGDSFLGVDRGGSGICGDAGVALLRAARRIE